MKADKAFKWRSCHSIHRLTYHVVFIPKYRRKVLIGRLVQRLSWIIYEAAKMNKWFIHELSIQEDHVHMMIQLPPTITVAKAVMYLKGGTSKVIRQEFSELREFLWGDGLWQDGYFAETIGKIDEKALREYIRRQWEQE
jgi:putative transposase